MTRVFSTDIAIIGGGIAGLWLLNRLGNEGYHVALFEESRLGRGQTIASQGIIHGGLKYALHGKLDGAAEAIAAMPARWRECLGGRGDVDLRECSILSEHYYMWSSANYRSKLKAFLGSRALRGRISPVASCDYPEFFKRATIAGSLYQLPDFVVDSASLLETLKGNWRDRIFNVDLSEASFSRSHGAVMTIPCNEGLIEVSAQRMVFCAGEGNAALMNRAGISSVNMQSRPLHMVIARGRHLPLGYVHCVGDKLSLTPELTLTAHHCEDGDVAWYLGGELAESGMGRDSEAQVRAAASLLHRLFPWIDLDDVSWNTFLINRAEARLEGRHRPDDAFLHTDSHFSVAWPTKLTLSPNLADQVMADLNSGNIHPSCQTSSQTSSQTSRPESTDALRKLLPLPAIAAPPWDSPNE
ncbi:MAG: FAD-dependent oxidoreductase [Pseudohongiellaceae bacterium]